jgi:DNA-binding NtrC family response regulator
MRDAGTFRGDLFYRLSTHFIEIPPLRQRPRDIVPLVRHFVCKAAAELGVDPPVIPPALIQLLSTHTFPGNVRELEAMIFDGVAKVRGRALSLALFEPHLAREGGAREVPPSVNDGTIYSANLFAGLDSLPTLTEVQSQLIDDALRRADGNQGIAARLLGISRSALNKRLHHQDGHTEDAPRALSE